MFLDEIGDMPLHLQPKILRVLQERQFTRVGGKEVITVDIRLIAATNCNLEEMAKNGEFREDLYYRLNVIPITLPALKDRNDDILLLSEYLLNKYGNLLKKGPKRLSDELITIFKNYSWPGNIRELENVIEYLVNITKDDIITPENLPVTMKQKICTDTENGPDYCLKTQLEQYECKILSSMLDRYGRTTESKAKIASILGINLATLYRKLSKYNLQN
ncbi:MAG: sigma 54-interacting transcriptional regulator [Thermoanaerobacteraceae bacterium]|nr:sigma 54-interacting transcriptional regulator [Thermoanaerobacteraceae bacterium]